MATISPTVRQQFLDLNGDPLSGGLLHTTENLTDTDKITWKEDSETTPNANPIILDSRGECDLHLVPNELYRYRLEDSLGNLIWQRDGIINAGGGGGAGTATQVASIAALKLTSPSGLSVSEVLGYYAAGDEGGELWYWKATSTSSDNGITVIELDAAPTEGRYHRVNAETITFRQAGARGDGLIDDTAVINAVLAIGETIKGTEGDYLISGAITVPLGATLIAEEGAVLNAASAQVVTVTEGGGFECGMHQFFGTDVTAVFNDGTLSDPVVPHWFGGLGDGSNDDTIGIASAMGSGATGSTHRVRLPSGRWKTDAIEWPADYQVILKGDGYRGSILRPTNTDGTSAIHIGPLSSDANKAYLGQFKIETTETCGHGIFSDVPGIGVDIEDVFVKGLTGVGKAGIYLKESFFCGLKNIRIDTTYDGLTIDRSKGVMAWGQNWIAGCPNINLNIIDGQAKTGTVSMGAGLLTLVGSGTTFESDFQISAKGRISWVDDSGETVIATIDSITNNLEIIITAAFLTAYPTSVTTAKAFGTYGTSSGNELQLAEIGLAALDIDSQAIYCESSNQHISIAFYENFTNPRSIEFTSQARNNRLVLENASTIFIRDDGYNNIMPLGFGATMPGVSGSNGFIGPLIGNGPITNLFFNSSYIDTQSSGFSGISTSVETGTITTAAASTQVDGVGTSFQSDPDIIVGGSLAWEDDAASGKNKRIASIASEIELQLTEVAGSIATGVAFSSTFQPLRSVIDTQGYLDGSSLQLDWGTKSSVNGSKDGVNSNQTFAVTAGDTIHAIMMVKATRDFAADEFIQMRIIGAASANRSIVPLSKVYTDRWVPMLLIYKVEFTENVRMQLDFNTNTSTHAALITYHDDFTITKNTNYPTLVYNPEPATTQSNVEGAYIPRLTTKKSSAVVGTNIIPLLGGKLGALAVPFGTSSTSEETMYSLPISLHTFPEDMTAIKFTCFGRTAANANDKTVKIKFGYFDIAPAAQSVTIIDTTALALNDVNWRFEGLIIRQSLTSVNIATFNLHAFGEFNSPIGPNVFFPSDVDPENAMTFSITGQAGDATADELILDSVLIEYFA